MSRYFRFKARGQRPSELISRGAVETHPRSLGTLKVPAYGLLERISMTTKLRAQIDLFTIDLSFDVPTVGNFFSGHSTSTMAREEQTLSSVLSLINSFHSPPSGSSQIFASLNDDQALKLDRRRSPPSFPPSASVAPPLL